MAMEMIQLNGPKRNSNFTQFIQGFLSRQHLYNSFVRELPARNVIASKWLFHCQNSYSTKLTRPGLRAGLAWQRQPESGPVARDSQVARDCLAVVTCSSSADLAGLEGPGSTGNSAAHAPAGWQQHHEAAAPRRSVFAAVGDSGTQREARRRSSATSHTPPVARSGAPRGRGAKAAQ